MSADVLICPNCRARVFGTWQACKFCGTTLRVSRIDAAVDPEDLVSSPEPAASGAGVGSAGAASEAAPSGPRSPWGRGWSSWAGAGGGDASADGGGAGSPGTGAPSGSSPWVDPDSGPGAPGAGGAPSSPWATGGATTADRSSSADAAALVPVEGADQTWAPGPAPGASGGPSTGDGAGNASGDALAWVDDGGPSGLPQVDWWADSGASGGTDTTGGTGTSPDTGTSESSTTDASSWFFEPSGSDPGETDAPWGFPGSSLGSRAAPEGPDDSNLGWSTGSRQDADRPPDSAGDTPDPPRPGPSDELADRESDEPADRESDEPADRESDEERFDPDAIFRDPVPDIDPVFDSEFGSDLEQVAPAGALDIDWQPAAANAWDAPVEPKGKPKRQAVLSRESKLLVGGIIVALLAVVAVSALKNRHANHPDAWAASVQQTADWVAKTRGVPFKYPVAVVTLDAKDFDAAANSASTPTKDKDRAALSEQVAMWRALGALQGDGTARLNVVTAQRPELGAFYDLAAKRLVLRNGTGLDDLREGVAGALSVALDDQRAHLSALQSPGIEENPLFDVVFGTAALIRSDYRRQSTGAARTPSKALQLPALDGPDAILQARPELQVRLGEPFVQIVGDAKGLPTVNGLAASPPASSQQVMLPQTYFDGQGGLRVPRDPSAPAGTQTVGSGTLGAQTWFLLLAGHATDQAAVAEAVAFADGWVGDSFVAYRKPSGQVCVTDVLRSADAAGTPSLVGPLTKWSDAIPSGRIGVHDNGDGSVSVTGCDPGATADQGLGKMLAPAVTAAVTRSQLGAFYYAAGKKIPNGVNGPVFSPDVALCMGDKAVALARPDQLGPLGAHDAVTFRDLTLAAAGQCGSNLADQLFVGGTD